MRKNRMKKELIERSGRQGGGEAKGRNKGKGRRKEERWTSGFPASSLYL
jgi:hypothetical protein